jgi:hypothetical protein
MPLACKICIANKGLKGSEIGSLPQNEEELMEHLERVHHMPIIREGETKQQLSTASCPNIPKRESARNAGLPVHRGREQEKKAMVEQIGTKSLDGYISIGDLRTDTEVYVSQSLTPEGDRLFLIVRWKDKEHTDCNLSLLAGREMEKLHRLVKQWRKRERSSRHD